MTFLLISPAMVEAIHDSILNPGELPGRARDKCLEGALSRVDTRLTSDLIGDVFDLAAAHAVAIAQRHCFNDGYKRTAFRVMQVCPDMHGQVVPPGTEAVGDIIIRAAQRLMDEGELAEWLRQRA